MAFASWIDSRSPLLRSAIENQQLEERNRQLGAEVRDLKTGLDALEERARSDLGMIASHETFYQVVPPSTGARTNPRTVASR